MGVFLESRQLDRLPPADAVLEQAIDPEAAIRES